jgi:hypothetical protein
VLHTQSLGIDSGEEALSRRVPLPCAGLSIISYIATCVVSAVSACSYLSQVVAVDVSPGLHRSIPLRWQAWMSSECRDIGHMTCCTLITVKIYISLYFCIYLIYLFDFD